MSIKRLLDFGELLGNPFGGATALDADPGAALLRPESQFQRAGLTGDFRVPVCATGELLERSMQRNLQTNCDEGDLDCFLYLGEIRSSWQFDFDILHQLVVQFAWDAKGTQPRWSEDVNGEGG